MHYQLDTSTKNTKFHNLTYLCFERNCRDNPVFLNVAWKHWRIPTGWYKKSVCQICFVVNFHSTNTERFQNCMLSSKIILKRWHKFIAISVPTHAVKLKFPLKYLKWKWFHPWIHFEFKNFYVHKIEMERFHCN